MANQLNEQQRKAVDARHGNFLIAAGAGSGKTQVLTTRIKDIVVSGDAKVDELLVLTFTKKAADEMKKRTRGELLKTMPEEAEKVETSDISTFDAFFLKLVKKYAYRLGVDPDIGVANDAFLDVYRSETIDRLIEKRYREGDVAILEMTKLFVLRNDDHLVGTINAILNGTSLTNDVKGYFKSLKEDFFKEEYLEKRKKEFYDKCNKDLRNAFELTSFGSSELLADDNQCIAPFVNLGSYEALYEKIVSNPPKLRNKNSKRDFLSSEEEVRRAIAKGYFYGVGSVVTSYGDPNRQIEKILSTKPYIALLVDIAEEAYEELQKYKKDKNAYSFSDIASLARKLLDDKEILEKIKSQYKYIMIDEYQDTSDLQEDFIKRIANDNLFLVGDIKQSIYRFRNANPDIFSEKLREYSKGNGGEVIPLPKNYRSRKEVIGFVNELFSRIMSPLIGDVDYNDGQALEFGNDRLYGNENKKEYRTKILEYEKPEDMNGDEAEARIIAKDILDKVNSGFLLDVKGEGRRPCSWGDFTVLTPTKSKFGIYEKVFKEAKIPLVVIRDQDFSDDNINLLFMSLLKMPLAMDSNEVTVKHCYASIKRSYVYQEDDDQLFDELQNGTYEDDELIKNMRSDRNALLNMGVHDATMFLIEKYGLIDKLLAIGDVKENFEKIKHLVDLSVEADRMGLSYSDYVTHFERLKEYKLIDKISINKGVGNQVNIMSIHASKGLEFPVIYCPNNKRRYNRDDVRGYYITTRDYGLLFPYNRTDEISKNFLYDLFKQEESRKALSEYMRLFYVDLTRASDQIIFVLPESVEEEHFKFKIKATGDDILGRLSSKKTGVLPIDSFSSFLSMACNDFIESELEAEKVEIAERLENKNQVIPESNFQTLELRNIKVEERTIESHRASKESLIPTDGGSLELGTRLHRLLEVTDFISKDTSFIEDKEDKRIIDKVLRNGLFDNLEGFKVFKEYQYFDDEENVNGIIDLLLVKKNEEAIIVDYKTMHIDDPAYESQLKAYKRYVDRAFGVDSKTYLLSIIKGELKVVE